MAAASIRPILHRIAALPFFSAAVQKPNFLHIPTTTQFHLPRLHIKKSLLLPASPRGAAAAAAVIDDEDYDGEEEEDEEEQQASASPRSSAPPGDERRLYIGNLPYSMTSAQLKEIFSQAGTVDAVEIVYDRVTDRSRGFGFVTMSSGEEANHAIRMFNGVQVGGRTAKVNFPEVPRGGEREVLGPRARRGSPGFVESPYKVYAGNLSWAVSSESLRDAFAAQPGLIGAKVVYNRDSGLSRGFGFLSFASPEEAQSAIDAMNGKEVEGRPLRLSIAAGRPSAASQPMEQLSAVES